MLRFGFLSACLLAVGAAAGLVQPAAAVNRPGVGDPAAYCRALRNVDEPGTRGMAPGVPAWMRHRLGAPRGAAIAWRCLNGRVFACVDGGGSEHCSRADTSRVATRDMREFCVSSPGQSIPGAVTGSETIFAWTCAGRTPRIARQWARVDHRGFALESWQDVTPRAR